MASGVHTYSYGLTSNLQSQLLNQPFLNQQYAAIGMTNVSTSTYSPASGSGLDSLLKKEEPKPVLEKKVTFKEYLKHSYKDE